jgi:hypothetical protein
MLAKDPTPTGRELYLAALKGDADNLSSPPATAAVGRVIRIGIRVLRLG